MRRRAALAAALLVLGMPAAAWADGDPASDVLLGQAVFLPYSPVSHVLSSRLYAVAAAAAAHGYPVRVAVIGARTDLGTVPAVFGRPELYARFLSTELPGAGPVLVAMPQGFGLASNGHALAVAPLRGLVAAAGTGGLLSATVTAVVRLSAAAGHPLPIGATDATSTGAASPSTVRHALLAIALLGALAAVGMASAWRARGRAAGAR